MRRVYKYRLEPQGLFAGHVTVELPIDAQLVLFDRQDGRWQGWFEITTNETEVRDFCIVGTGFEIPNGYIHQASFQEQDPDGGGPFVWHLYERPLVKE